MEQHAQRGGTWPPSRQGMYDPANERDACGLGFIAHIKGHKNHAIIRHALAILEPEDRALKVPHMAWNDLVVERAHPVLDGIATGDHAYFVHSYHFRVTDPAHRLAFCDYGGPITAIVGRDNILGTKFHPEKSQAAGLHLIGNFLRWTQ